MKHLLRLCLACLLGLLPASAQVLARPGWAGSGVAPEAWWLRAVFYRVDPARFQDSDGDGLGDLQGLVQRLDYIQSLGVDALLLDGTLPEPGTLDDLVREASRRQLRVLITLDDPGSDRPKAETLQKVQGWLSAGVAGLWVPKATGKNTTSSGYADLLASLSALLQSYPGERVLLTDPAPVSISLATRPERRSRSINPSSFHAARDGRLVTTALFAEQTADVDRLRVGLRAASQEPQDTQNAQEPGSAIHPLLRAETGAPTGSPNTRGDAALLLGSRGAAMLNFGEEIGLDLYPGPPTTANNAVPPAPPDSPARLVMQWTPSNLTPAPLEHPASTAPATPPGSETVFGAYHPYVPPPRGLATQPSSTVHVTVDRNIPADLPDPDSLPGYTTAAHHTAPVDGAKLNVTTEDRDPRSLLNAYRQMIALHHGNPTLRNGTQYLLASQTEGTLVWVRRAPAGSRTAANVIVAANFSGLSQTINVDADLEANGMRGGALRLLFASAIEAQTGASTRHLLLPPHGVLIAEIYHTGADREAAPTRHSGARRHRVRR